MICPYCGAENSDSSTFCDLCLNVFNAPGAGMQAPFAPSAGEPPAPPEYGQPPQPGYGQGFVAGQPPGPAYDLGAGKVDPGSVPPAANQVPRGAIPPQALQSDAYWHMEWATDSKIKELKEIRDRPKAPIDQVRDLYPEDHTWYSLYGFAVAVAGAGAVFFLLATNFFIRFFIIASMPSPSSSGTEVAAANHLSLVGIIIGSLIVVGVVFALSYLVGFRGARLGTIMGGVCAGHLVVFQGISFLLLANWVFKLMRTVNGGGFQLKWWYLGLGLLVLVPIGMLAGWVGQNVALNRTFGNLSFNQLLSYVGIGLAALLFIVGIGGLVKGAIAKPTTSNLSAAFMSMKQMTGWQANISGVDGSETLLYEKGKGFKTDTTIVMTEGKAYKYNKVSEKWNESPPASTSTSWTTTPSRSSP